MSGLNLTLNSTPQTVTTLTGSASVTNLGSNAVTVYDGSGIVVGVIGMGETASVSQVQNLSFACLNKTTTIGVSVNFNTGSSSNVALPISDSNVETSTSQTYSTFTITSDTSTTTTSNNVPSGTLFSVVWGDIVSFFNNISAKVISLINLVNTQQVSINNIISVLTAGSETLATFSTATQTITGTTFVQVPLTERTTTGNIVAGNYVIPSASQVGALVKLIATLNYQQSAPTGTGNVQLVNLGTVANPASIILGTRAFVTGNTNVQQITINSGITVGSTRTTTSVLAGDRIQLQANDTGTGTINLVGGTGATANNTILMFLTATGVSLSQSQYKLITVAKNPSDYSNNANSTLNEYCTSDLYGLATLNPAFPAGTFASGYNYIVNITNNNQVAQTFEVLVNGKTELVRRTAPVGNASWTGISCYSNYIPCYSSVISFSQMQRYQMIDGSVYNTQGVLTSGLSLYRATLSIPAVATNVSNKLIVSNIPSGASVLGIDGTIYSTGDGGVWTTLSQVSWLLVNQDGNASPVYLLTNGSNPTNIYFAINSTSAIVGNFLNQPMNITLTVASV